MDTTVKPSTLWVRILQITLSKFGFRVLYRDGVQSQCLNDIAILIYLCAKKMLSQSAES